MARQTSGQAQFACNLDISSFGHIDELLINQRGHATRIAFGRPQPRQEKVDELHPAIVDLDLESAAFSPRISWQNLDTPLMSEPMTSFVSWL